MVGTGKQEMFLDIVLSKKEKKTSQKNHHITTNNAKSKRKYN